MALPRLYCYGVRGSIPAAGREFTRYGGNTASFAVETPGGSLVLLDAGTGLLQACDERLSRAHRKVFLAISHTHADHVYGLGMSRLRWRCLGPGRRNLRPRLLGPPGVRAGLDQFYDGRHTWPVVIGKKAPDRETPCIDPGLIRALGSGVSLRLDGSTGLSTLEGNHPVAGGSLLYRLDFAAGPRTSRLVYATDCEFDFLPGGVPNPDAERLRRDYVAFAKRASMLMADAQVDLKDYRPGAKVDRRGHGHAPLEQVIEMAALAGVRRLLVIHHPRLPDAALRRRELHGVEIGRRHSKDMKIEFAREGSSLPIR